MSDKSFGDHMNRNIVKNPLLSTAVTGLSFDDLTHNAVLLPVVRTQEINIGQDGSQNATLGHAPNRTSNVPSGDSNLNNIASNNNQNNNQIPINPMNTYDDQIKDNFNATASKASVKSDDDFDVNEYFERLQRTVYVSAPVNVDKQGNVDLAAKEENLEEVNLNEPDRGQSQDVQQSITADIAQNFSQLPQVLPQVASAVFSSFSNMLSYKSREQTPDESRVAGYQEVQFQRPEPVEVEPPRPVGPPPKEPPVNPGITGFRMATKKKTYAQIPGLSNAQTVPAVGFTPPTNPTNPSYFVPQNTNDNIPQQFQPSPITAPNENIASNKDFYNIFNPNVDIQSNIPIFEETQAKIPPVSAAYSVPEDSSSTNFDQSSVPVIPPPPMFSNLSRKDSQGTIEKAILPPSVARRISSTQPVIKAQSQSVPAFTDNVFIPPPVSDYGVQNPESVPVFGNVISSSSGNNFPTSTFPPVSNFPQGLNLPPQLPPARSLQSTTVPQSTTLFTPSTTSEIQQGSFTEAQSSSSMSLNSSTPISYSKNEQNVPLFSSQGQNPAPQAMPPITPSSMFSSQIPVAPNTVSTSGLLTTAELPVQSPPTSALPLPPTFFNPTSLQGQLNLAYSQTAFSQSAHVLNPPPESSKPVMEPPKMTGNVNYRMTKKRPQYYAGPIEGVGAISNNIKPIVPPVQIGAIQGPSFNQPEAIQNLPQPGVAANVTQAPLDIMHPVENVGSYPAFDISTPQSTAYSQPQAAAYNPPQQDFYNTVFDLSRPSIEHYEPPKEEARGFGIIGSLKSKLSSIDINKIQSKVTTFFDPEYNSDVKNETSTKDDQSYGYQQQYTNMQYPNADQSSNLEIFVANPEPMQQYAQNYDSQPNCQNYAQLHQEQYYPNQKTYNYYENQQNNSFYSMPSQQDINTANSQVPSSNAQQEVSANESIKNEKVEVQNSTSTVTSDDNLKSMEQLSTISNASLNTLPQESNLPPKNPNTSLPIQSSTQNTIEKESNASSFFDSHHLYERKSSLHSEINRITDEVSNMIITPETESKIIDNIVSSIAKADNERVQYEAAERRESAKNYTSFESIQPNNFFNYFDNKNILTADTQSTDHSQSRNDTNNHPPYLFSMSSSFEKNTSPDSTKLPETPLIDEAKQLESQCLGDGETEINTETVSDSQNSTAEFNICETCREVNKPDFTDEVIDDVTLKLIKNITTPIQLLNPVEVPLTESNTPVNDTAGFDSDMCTEISAITEETIETIQVQSAVEMLDDINEPPIYGWRTDNNNAYTAENPLGDHDYAFNVNPESAGFYSDNSLFFDNIPNNASDEIKAEYQHIDDPAILIKQISIPSAPPAEDDAKSDETGVLDVLSIEQDAKKDFPIFEEYVIEPSETDDDKIECKERSKSSDDNTQEDTFTNRVEKFKKMEETSIHAFNDGSSYGTYQLFDAPTTNSSGVSIASYFDTGNYAAETHYRNSLTSPTSVTAGFSVGSPNVPMRIPPGFEGQFERLLNLDPTPIVSPIEAKTSGQPEFLAGSASCSNEFSSYIPKLENRGIPIINHNLLSSKSEEIEDDLDLIKSPDFDRVYNDLVKGGFFRDTPEINSSPTANICHPSVSFASDETPLVESESSTSDSHREPVDVASSVPEKPAQSVPTLQEDPINFYSQEPAPAEAPESGDGNFNRLASYFMAPPKPEQKKSFFELSQSQNHFRHNADNKLVTNPKKDSKSSDDKCKSFFELSQGQDHYMDVNRNIPDDVYLANLNLMRDLTSCQNINVNPDQIVRTVNYFTVTYDCDSINAKHGIGEPNPNQIEKENTAQTDKENSSSKEPINKPTNNFGESKTDKVDDTEDPILSDKMVVSIIKNCKYCCNINSEIITIIDNVDIDNVKNIKVKKAMDNDKSDVNRKEVNMNSADSPDGKGSMSVNFDGITLHDEGNDDGVILSPENRVTTEYTPVKHHWFYRVDFEGKSIWRGFSVTDSSALETAYHSEDLNENTLVPTDGGRYDVNVMGRLRMPVYWSDKPTNVNRCSWFYKGATDARYVPYSEDVAEKLEEEYRRGITTNTWHRRLVLPNNEAVVLHGPAVMVHFLSSSRASDPFSTPTQSTIRPRVVRRGCAESEIEDSEPSHIDHLLLLCHGVGSACDMRFRAVEEVVDDFRATSLQLVQSHYKNSYDNGIVGRVEVLPISWHATLHSGSLGVDRRLARITLDSIPRLRSFTNDTVLDVLFYTSPVYCQTIIDTVCGELNRIYNIFKKRNKNFTGGISLGGHSLGSVILYDLLCHQINELKPAETNEKGSGKQFVTDNAVTQPNIKYPQLDFHVDALYALGSPIAIFECIRGVDILGESFHLPTCKNFFNIFHPYDPIAYRIEPLVNPDLKDLKPHLIPHHKGRKRMHLELKETMTRVGADIKQKLFESIKSTWTSMWKTQPPPSDHQLEKVVEEEMEKEQLNEEAKNDDMHVKSESDFLHLMGKLNAGRRIDYVLQEAPFEMINEYLFAMGSHVCYWESEDTMLMILREIYTSLGVNADCSVPQHTMSVQRTRTVGVEEDTTVIMSTDTQHPSTSRAT